MIKNTFWATSLRQGVLRGRLHGAFSTPGLNSALLINRVEFFCDYMDDFNPGVETLYYTFSASIRGSKKAFILFSCNK
jgi:hypothetical protein